VPYFVEWVGGVPDFRIISPAKWRICVARGRCWICGEPLGRWKTFVMGPKSAAARLSSEPPSHSNCATFAMKACPFILLPSAKHRPIPGEGVQVIPTVDPHNPGTYCMWTTDSFELVDAGKNGTLIRMGAARELKWYVKGIEQQACPVKI
jgi:hypothetical protein